MSDQKMRATLARCSAALSLFALAAFSLDAAGAATRVPFQQQTQLNCQGGTCTAYFVDLPANQALDINNVWCELGVIGGTANRAYIYSAPLSPVLKVPLEIGWDRFVGTIHYYTFRSDPNLRVALGRRLVAEIQHTGSGLLGFCTFTGFKITV